MSTFSKDIETAADGEAIEAIIIKEPFNFRYNDERKRGVPESALNRLMKWEEAKELLAYSYDSGYGSQDCHDIYAWTRNLVLFVWEYDGSTHVHAVPRSPEVYVLSENLEW